MVSPGQTIWVVAIKHAQLSHQKPAPLNANIDACVGDAFPERLPDTGSQGFDHEPPAPTGLAILRHKLPTRLRLVDRITDLYRKGFLSFRQHPNLPQTDTAPVLEYMVRNPQIFKMSEDNIALRETYARLTHAPPSRILLHKSRRSIERAIAQARRPEAIGLPGHDSAYGGR